tara:strand:+ start:132 stop:461 length:330 start_codon:yes stop_codon:yes gene_type:complete
MATRANIVIDQGSTYTTDLNLTDENGDALNLSGYSANSQIRKHYTSSNSVTFSTSVNAVAGVITLSLTANQTSNLISGRYVYDVELTDASNSVSRIVEGIVTVTPQVTR